MFHFSDQDNKKINVIDKEKIKKLIRELLITLGENPDRPGLVETPKRVASMWEDFFLYNPGKTDTCFEATTIDQMIIISGIRVFSFCEHHLLPFSCDISIGYIARGKVLGLSKFARIAHKHAHKLQLQERLCEEIADEIITITGSPDVAVYGKGEHSCMSSRGIKTSAIMINSIFRGAFRTENAIKADFLQIIC